MFLSFPLSFIKSNIFCIPCIFIFLLAVSDHHSTEGSFQENFDIEGISHMLEFRRDRELDSFKERF